MNVSVHIERLILDGIDVPYHQRPALQAAVTAELARLLAEGGLQPGLSLGGAVWSVSGGGIRLREGNHPEKFGQQIAHAVYGGMGR